MASKEVAKVGLSFQQLPPAPVVVHKVAVESWAEQMGFQGGEEILLVNGREVSGMDPESFKQQLKQRPLVLRRGGGIFWGERRVL